MSCIPAPPPLSYEEWKKAGRRDIAFERWVRYYALPWGFILLLWDKLKKKEIK